jgi:glutamine synthetase
MVGSSQSISDTNTIINTAVAEVLSEFADKLEGKKSPDVAAKRIIKDYFTEHKRIIFNGNNYTKEWEEEAKRRGLYNLSTAADAIPYMSAKKNIELFSKMGILSATEVISRTEIMIENYCKTLTIEARTMADMVKTEILPSIFAYISELASTSKTKTELGISIYAEKDLLSQLSGYADEIYKKSIELDKIIANMKNFTEGRVLSEYCRDVLIPAMNALRDAADSAEPFIPERLKPFPGYGDLLYGI